jgi:hypothetical protein
MTQATIELTAAIIGLIAVTIPVIRSFFKWAHGKGILRLIISALFDFFALACYLLAVVGIFNHWFRGLVLWLLFAVVFFAALGFCTQLGAPGRVEIALFVLQIATVVTLLGIGIFVPAPSNQNPTTVTASPTPTPFSN